MEQTRRPRLSVSTWSLHRTLGRPPVYGPDASGERPSLASASLPLVDLPGRLAPFGIHTLEICHFHLPSRTPDYLAKLRQALDAAGIELFSLLIDGGDITDEIHRARDLAWIEEWIEVAGQLGAANARVIAGKAASTPATLTASLSGLTRLCDHADQYNVRLMTENWLGLMASPADVKQILDGMDGRVGLCADFGNWRGPGKYDDLAEILPRAESCHAKCHFADSGQMDQDDYTRCLDLARNAGFSGPYTLIYDGPNDDEWAGLAQEKAIVERYC